MNNISSGHSFHQSSSTDNKFEYESSSKMKQRNELDSSTADTIGTFTKTLDDINSFEEESDTEYAYTTILEQSSKWERFYYEYIVADKSTIGIPFLHSFMYNHDLRPVEKARRVWSWYNYLWFWLAECFNINTWEVADTGLQLGLNWWQCWITVWLGYSFVAIFVSLSSRIGAAYHLSFPVSARASFGVYFSLWPIINRVVLAIIWYSVQAWICVTPISLMLQSIFGTDLPTRIPDNINQKNTTTYEFMCFFIFWVVSFPFLLVPPHKIRHLFTVKACLVPFACFGFLIWAVRKADGKIALDHLTDYKPTGSDFSWAFIRSMMTCMNNFSTLTVNAPDFSRFSKTKISSLYSQMFAIPFLFSITSLIGILVTAAGYELYGENYWSPVDVLQKFLDDSFSKGTRAGVFLISFVFVIAQLGTNISANSLSCGTDMSALVPKFINIRRGSMFCAFMALCICPWNLLASSSKFTAALSAYAIFLSSIAGVLAADYFVVRRGYIKLSHLYSNQPGSYYMFGNRYGFNWRACVAYFCGVAPNLPGFIGDVGAPQITVSEGATKLYYLSYWIGWFVSFLVYITLCYFFPVEGSPVENILKDKGWFQRWADVEDFEKAWIRNSRKVDLYDDVSTIYDHEEEEKFF
ncbi:hypothetical protein TPHA_0M00630 [Tetrapisispora phaffii CBS 4417]|uniref:Uracil permease n=1 Tax=Tetrapisispora phaffii (strain ATCC 24235 / CBS 4417 / NBRC 1672 / NRRL Y-8282 / UCD 70-5) TaxID=1071381 RepID=G8C0C3_TETPH|nr:hypothetical protein TPHA_0M00630 [Tetrapisispora phaffii CBS 4417]CCE65638.1 hypothetical protein TPHA_0M00630 [Tetrapisispora phaffii CBS 4417]